MCVVRYLANRKSSELGRRPRRGLEPFVDRAVPSEAPHLWPTLALSFSASPVPQQAAVPMLMLKPRPLPLLAVLMLPLPLLVHAAAAASLLLPRQWLACSRSTCVSML